MVEAPRQVNQAVAAEPAVHPAATHGESAPHGELAV